MSTPITRHQRELCNLAIVVAQQQDTIDGLLKSYEFSSAQVRVRDESLEELRVERETLLAENSTLRADLIDFETVRELSELYQKQSLEFCRNYEREEKRANSLQTSLNKAIAKLHTARGFGSKGVASKKGKRK
jgi:hypothetical protein